MVGDMSTSMTVDETLSASTKNPVGYNTEAMTCISRKASNKKLDSNRDHISLDKVKAISNVEKSAIIYSRQKCPSKLTSETKTCEISNKQLVILENQSNRSCSRQVTKGLLADQNNRIKINCDSKQNNHNNIERRNEKEMSSICWTKRKEKQESSTIWNYDNCYHTCSSSPNNNNNNIEYGNGGQNEKCSHSSSPVHPRLGLFCTSTTLLRSNECSTLTKTITHRNIFQHHVTSNFVTLVMKNLLAPLSFILSVASSVMMNNKLFVKISFQVLLCIFMLLCCSTTVFGSPVASAGPGPLGVAKGSSLQQTNGLSPFPEGRGPDGTLYKTDYRCEGENMTVTCEGSDGPGRHGAIRVVRANFGRFSIAICNRHGTTDWNVNCFAPQTTKTLQQRCDGKTNCVVAVDSTSFHDACPGTHKYLEIHYACQSRSQEAIPSEPKGPRRKKPALPPWIPSSNVKQQPKGPSVRIPKGPSAISPKSLNITKSNRNGAEAKPVVEKVPILVTARATPDNSAIRRVPITTPSTTTSTSTTETIPTTQKIIEDSTLVRNPKNRNDKFKKERNGLPNDPSSTIKEETRKKPQFGTSRTRNNFPNQSSGSRKNVGIVDTSIKSGASNEGRISQTLNKPSSDIKCPPITSRQLQWDWTPAGQEAMQLCPIGAIGLAKWSCVMQDDSSARWLGNQPDMSGCKSVAVDNLEAQVRKEDPETVLVSSLAYLTRTRSLYGGDLESTVKIMREVASRLDYRLKSTSGSFHNKEAHVKQVVQDVLRAATHILEDSNRKAWWDLSGPTRLKVATDLLLALEENAFLLAGVVNEPSEILETHEIMTMAISVVDVSGRTGRHSRIGGGSGLYNIKEDNNDRYRNEDNNIHSPNSIIFPNKRLLFVDDSIELSKKDLADNSKEGLAEAVFFSYASLHEIMSSTNDGEDNHESMNDAGLSPIIEEMRMNNELSNDAKESNWKLNSRVISAALGSGRHIELSHPVTIELRHLNEENMTDPVCVFWDYERHGWSGSGCRVVATNESITTCQCDHLTSFAVLMREMNEDVIKNTMALNVRLDIIAYIVVSVVAIAFLIAAIKYRRQIFEYFSCCCQNGLGFRHSGSKSCLKCLCCFSRSHSNKKQSHLEKCQSFYTGLSSQNHSQYVLTGQHLQAQNLLQCNGAGTLQHVSNPQQGYPSYHGNTICGGLLIGNGVNNLQNSGQQLGAGNIATMSAIAAGKNSRPHITLNPYSTQLVDNINMMMPNNGSTTSSSNSNDSSGTNRIGKSMTANNSSSSNSSSSTASTTLGRQLLNPQMNNNLMMNPQLNTLTNTLRGGNGMPISDSANSNIQVDQDFSQATNGEVVYRAVSPHGHVYWEIDPGQVYAATLAANNSSAQQVHQQQQLSEENVALLVANQNNINFQPMQHHNPGINNAQNLSEEEMIMHQLQQQQYCHPEMRPLINQVSTPAPLQCNVGTLVQQHAQPGMIMVNSSTPSNNGYNGATTLDFRTNADNSSTNRSSAFVRNRFKQLPATSRRGKQQQIVSSVSSPLSPNNTGVDSVNTSEIGTSNTTNNITETLQTQVQIRDIKPIQGITVKSSEYIEAKIRTLRKNNNNVLSHQNSGNQASRN